MEYKIEYNSTTHYDLPVTEGVFEFNVVPCHNSSQVLKENYALSSISNGIFVFKNIFGFEIIRVNTKTNFKKFNFKLNAIVVKQKVNLPFESVMKLNKELEILNDAQFFIEHHLFLRKSPLTEFNREMKAGLLPINQFDSLFAYLNALNGHIYSILEYQKNVTNVNSTAYDALKLKRGVCQDFAHIFIAIARENKIPIRYVSGYLNQGKKFQGTSFMHAWVEAFIPGLDWVGFDPTNNLMVDENYIKVSHGADYADCAPIKGVLKSLGQESKSDYQVKVVQQ